MSTSVYAQLLRCSHCGKQHAAEQWPVNGDLTPFYFQKERGRHSLEISCPHCFRTWFVVWDDDPGQIEKLEGLAHHETLGEAMARSGMSAVDVLKQWSQPDVPSVDHETSTPGHSVDPALSPPSRRCDICSANQNDPLNWRVISHADVKLSPLLIQKAVQRKLPHLDEEQITREVRNAWLVDVERDVGTSDWLLCPGCSRLVGDFEDRACELERQNARSSRASAEQAVKRANEASTAAARSVLEISQSVGKIGAILKKLPASSTGTRIERIRTLAQNSAAGANRGMEDAKVATETVQRAAEKVKQVADKAREYAIEACSVGRVTVQGEYERYILTGSPAHRAAAKRFAEQAASETSKAHSRLETAIEAEAFAKVAATEAERLARRLYASIEYGLLTEPTDEKAFVEPVSQVLKLLQFLTAVATILFLFGGLYQIRQGPLGVLCLLLSIGGGVLLWWLSFRSPWALAKCASAARQLPEILESHMHHQLLDTDSSSEDLKTAVKKVTSLENAGAKGAAELVKMLNFNGSSVEDTAYVRWRAVSALQRIGLPVPADPVQLFDLDRYRRVKKIILNKDAAAELAKTAHNLLQTRIKKQP